VKRFAKVAIISTAARVALLMPLFSLAGCVATPPSDLPFDPPEQTIGERLFLETRFAEYFAEHMTDVNAPLGVGDPVVSDRLRQLSELLDRSGLTHDNRAIQDAHSSRSGRFRAVFPQWQPCEISRHDESLYSKLATRASGPASQRAA
jgi:hypothetical protein